MSYALPPLYGPLIHPYAVTASDRARTLRWPDAPHFVPFAIVVLACLPNHMMRWAEEIALHRGLQEGNIHLLLQWSIR